MKNFQKAQNVTSVRVLISNILQITEMVMTQEIVFFTEE